MRRYFAVAECRAGNFQFSATDERVIKLTRALHGATRNRPEVARDKIHQAEIQRFDAVQCGDVPYLVKRTMRFDEHVCRNGVLDAMALLNGAQFFEEHAHIVDATWLG